MGFNIYTTVGTGEFLKQRGVETILIKKVHEGRPNIVDAVKNHDIHLIINTPVGRSSKYDDSYIRMMAITHRVPYITSIAAAAASVEGIAAAKKRSLEPKSLQDYYKQLP